MTRVIVTGEEQAGTGRVVLLKDTDTAGLAVGFQVHDA